MHSYFKNDTIWAANLYGIYNSSPSARFVNPIQIGRPYCIYYIKKLESVLYHGIKTPRSACVEKRGRRQSFLTTSMCFETVVKNYFDFFIITSQTNQYHDNLP